MIDTADPHNPKGLEPTGTCSNGFLKTENLIYVKLCKFFTILNLYKFSLAAIKPQLNSILF